MCPLIKCIQENYEKVEYLNTRSVVPRCNNDTDEIMKDGDADHSWKILVHFQKVLTLMMSFHKLKH